ncbi:GntR family transcriptional regulator [Microtetraspora sp. AC03309]|uniref:GntR family transcriptional regulator n=1 Tax=Microtetraspora sp. AC03309 TaxID=2779376 RepID=UPI001E65B041|nr:GntR family transcriptional regulator [Microtetraspora sp. AC03309]MCC5578133.1 GntR family transcriptional regulator [Microtetraspora sp. AC03309]
MTEAKGNTRTAYEQIRQAIVEGRYLPGQRLIEQRIAKEFELSRTPVRESLRMLEAEGLVHSEPNRGAVVRSVSVEELADLYALRALLESFAAELAAARITDEDLARIDEGIALFEESIEIAAGGTLEGVRALSEANRLIHGAIIHAARHERLAQLLARTVDVPLVFQAFRQFDRSEMERSHLFHRLIRDAIAAHEGARAARLMSEHVLQGRDVLIARIQAHPQGAEHLFASRPT